MAKFLRAWPTGRRPLRTTPTRQLPKPILPYSVTVANLPATIDFIGITPGSVGVTQINYVVPANAPLGVAAGGGDRGRRRQPARHADRDPVA